MAQSAGDTRFGPDGLVAAIQEMALARSVPEIHRVVSRAARRINRAGGSNLVVVAGAHGRYVEEDGTGPGWKGRRIPLDGSLAGWSIEHRRPVVVDDVRADIRMAAAPYWSTPVSSLIIVPIRSQDPVGAIANYWTEPHTATGEEVRLLQALADSASVALENAAVRASLEDRVRQRTAELETVNRRLEREIAERRRVEDEVRQLSLVDELTGLYNRRGFNLLAGRELRSIQRTGRRALVMYIDIDGLKKANDTKGHEAGDRLLARAADVLRSVCRETDVAARLGGDEFAVFMTLGYDHPPVHLIVERYLDAARASGVSWSIGATASPPERVVSLDDLLVGADEAMYRGRRARRGVRPVAAGR
ncbi:MAG TPA: diguanylate cyclase [Acidimicrobiales bacterium]|nr:diguanylate cyclase [Acidimicrobiales bacterium]